MGSGKKKKSILDYVIHGPLNYNLLFAILFLCIYGLIMIYSASYYSGSNMNLGSSYFMEHQLSNLGIGIAGMVIVSKIDYHVWMKLYILGIIAAVFFIFCLKIPGLHSSALGADRWVKIGPIRFQAAEPIKLLLLIFIAKLFSKWNLKGKLTILLAWAPVVAVSVLLGFISNNMSTAAIILMICFVCFFVAQDNVKIYFILGGIGLIAVILFVLALEFWIPASEGDNFRFGRIRAFLHPDDYLSTLSQQPRQALYAIGAGGFWGKGLGQSLVKFKLSMPYNDYIFSIICEELGVFGVFILLFLFGYLLYQVVQIEHRAIDRAGKIFCTGVFAQVAIQTILNIMVNISWFPCTGVSLPFISYGGASVIFLLIEFGIVFNIDSYAKNMKYRKEAIKMVDAEDAKRNRIKMSL